MPVGAALFGNTASRSQNKNLVEFKAGKMTMKGKIVHPDKRKGVLYVYQSDDSLMHFCWKDRQTGVVEDDLIIFPDDCEFKRISQCTTGRVYVLKFKSSSRKFFFWVQEPKTEKDDEHCRRINEVLNNPPTPGSQRSGGGTPDGDLQNLLNNMSQQQLMQLFGGVGQIGGLSSLLGTMSRPSTGQSSRAGSTTSVTSTTSGPIMTTTTATTAVATAGATSTTTVTTATTATPKGGKSTATAASSLTTPGSQTPIQLSDLQSFLSGLSAPPPDAGSQPQTQQRSVDLSTTLTADNLQAMLGDPNIVRQLQQHLPAISTGGGASEQLRSTLASPQFQQALSMFSAALQSGQLGPVVQQFDVGSEAVTAATQGNLEDFVKALQLATISSSEEQDRPKEDAAKKTEDNPPKKEEDDDDEGMALD